MGYTRQALKGVSWVTALRFITRIITFLRIAILARILTPFQFGLFGIATLILSLLEILTETGINIVLIQQKDKIEKYLDSAWAISIIRGFIIFLVLVLLAPFISSFFNTPDSYSLILLISLVPLIRGFINPSIVKIQKELQFHKEFLIRLVLFVIDALVVIFFALTTKTAQSFVYGLIAAAFVEVMISFIFFRPIPAFSFEMEKFKYILKRGWWVTITGVFSYFAQEGDNMAVGKLMSASNLGLYQVAYKFSTLPISEITDVVNKVVFPVYSRFSDDKERLRRSFIRVFMTSSLLALILGAIIFLFAEQIVLLLLGEQWIDAIPPIQILSFYGVLRTVFGNFAPLFLAVGKQDYIAKMTLFRVVVLAVTIVPLVSAYGLMGAAFSALLSIVAEIPVISYYAYKVLKR